MPTTRRRHQVTETSEVERAIDLALRRWPGESRPRVLRRLIEVGAATVLADLDTDSGNRRARLSAMADRYGPFVSSDALQELRAEWRQ